MEIEFKNSEEIVQLLQPRDTSANASLIIHSGKTEKETKSLWGFIEDALSKELTIICHEDGYYILSQEAYGSMPHNTYEIILHDDKEADMVLELIEKHLEIKFE